MLDKVAEQVLALPKPALHRLAPILKAAEQEVTKELRAELRKYRGSATYTAQIHRNALVAVRRARSAIGQIVPTLADGLRRGARDAGRLATAHVQKDLARFHQIFDGSIKIVPINEAAVIARGDRLVLRRFPRSARRYGAGVRQDLVRELAISRARGESIRDATDRLMKRMPQVFDGQRYKAERLVRTETMNAYNVYQREAIIDLAGKEPGTLARWDAALDGRSCAYCRSLDGSVVDLVSGETFRVGRGRRARTHEQPPAHPMCRCVLTPWRAEWGDPPRAQDPDPSTPAQRGATARKAARVLGVKQKAAGTGAKRR